MTALLFSYGTLQKEPVQQSLFGRTLTGSADVLRGYTVAPIEITDEKFLARGEQKNQRIARLSGNESDRIEGTVFEVTEEELLLADRYEPADYRRIQVTLESGKTAWLYAAVERKP